MYRNILLPLDGSRIAESMLPCVSRIARVHGAKVTLLGVIRTIGAGSPKPPISGERRDDRLMGYLQGVAIFLGLGDVEAEPVVVCGDDPGQILTQARELGCDLVALLVHENASLGRGILGAVADAVLGPSDPSLIWCSPKVLSIVGKRTRRWCLVRKEYCRPMKESRVARRNHHDDD